MGAFGGLKHVDSINFKEKYYHAFQFEQSFWSQILLKICVLFGTIYWVKAKVKNTKQVLTSLAGRLQLWAVDCVWALYQQKCHLQWFVNYPPCSLYIVSDEWRCTQPGLLQTMRPKNFMSCNWALTRADRSFDTQRLCFFPSSIECQQRSLITPLIYRLIRLWRNANEPPSAMSCLPYIKVITM